MDWLRLFPDHDFRFPMGLRPGDPGQFFRSASRELADERRRWLFDDPDKHLYAVMPDDALDTLMEFAQAIGDAIPGPKSVSMRGLKALEVCMATGSMFAPDWVILRPDENNTPRLIGGAVCFPSGWAMTEKLGKTAHEIHAIVPGLNAALGRQIDMFLMRIEPGKHWERENWGLAADSELNHHPTRAYKKLLPDSTIEDTWLRLERQIFVQLPKTNCIVFGIDVTVHPLREIANQPEAAARLARSLETMPDEVSYYKGIGAARVGLAVQLKAAGFSANAGENSMLSKDHH